MNRRAGYEGLTCGGKASEDPKSLDACMTLSALLSNLIIQKRGPT